MKKHDEERPPLPEQPDSSGVSRRDFLKISSISVAVPMVVGPTVVNVAGEEVPVYGPGPVPVTLNVNGKLLKAQLEPRVTLLDALRDQFELTGAKRVCDRAECGACTVLLDGKPVYACSVLAVDAQNRKIETIESLTGPGNTLHPIQQAFIQNDAQQCGFCTPGFVVASKALLDKYPKPTPEQIHHELAGNYCRCGTYAGIRAALGGKKEA
ncbi:MAG TPA: 2Fe-2S iron-sulfur cluster-binding protein [Terriglobales bacterium]|nr:2Fe-2S iron-sulfur cluster-binding protein [Terriglobales bacterium]